MDMALLNGKIGDRIRIINYGHPIWQSKKEYKELYEAGYTGGKEVPDNILSADESTWLVDINPSLIGQMGIITEVTTTQGRKQYATTIVSWLSPNQLEKISMENWSQLVRREVLAGNIPSFVKGFTVTGVLKNGKRFKSLRKDTYIIACMVNLWNGSIWANLEDGTKVLIKRVIN